MTGSRILVLALLCAVFTAASAEEVQVKVLALFVDKALLQVNGQQKILSKGETFEGVTLQSAHGRAAVVVIDGEEMKLGLNQQIAGNFKKRESSRLSIVPDTRGMYYVNGTINGQSTSFLVDTGATYVSMSGRKARSLNIDFRRGVRSHAQTAAAIVPVWQVQLASVTVGTIKLRNVEAIVIEGDQPFDVLLGNSFLGRTEIRKINSILEITLRH